MRHKPPRPTTLAALVVLVLTAAPLALTPLGGCAALSKLFHPSPVASGENAYIVNAERTVRSAYTLADNFLALDDANREAMKSAVPQAHALAQEIRRTQGKPFFTAWDAVQTYKALAAPTSPAPSGDAVERELAAVEQLAARVREALAAVNTTPGAAPNKPAASSGVPALK
jgi:hypothetical protein